MAGDSVGRWLCWYPSAWRDRYADELVAFMEDSYGPEGAPWRARLSLLAGGLREHARQSGLSGDSAPPADRVRAGTLLVLVGWAAFVFAGSSFAKFSEHFDDALPGGINSHLPPASHSLPDVAYSILQWVAAVAGIAVLLGAVLVVPSLVRYLKSNGWRAIRGHLVRAVSVTVLTVGATGSLIGWAHHLSSQQRNGGDSLYGAMFIVWGALIALTLVAWTVAAVSAACRLSLARRVLLAECALAFLVGAAMTVMLVATAVWWVSIASDAPSFLSSTPSGAPVNPWLAMTAALMVGGVGMGLSGLARIGRNLQALRH